MRKLYENVHIFHFQKRIVSPKTIRGYTVCEFQENIPAASMNSMLLQKIFQSIVLFLSSPKARKSYEIWVMFCAKWKFWRFFLPSWWQESYGDTWKTSYSGTWKTWELQNFWWVHIGNYIIFQSQTTFWIWMYLC